MKMTELPEDVRVLLKATYHLCNKAAPLPNGRISVPRREFERVRAKSCIVQESIEKGE